jgi:chitosanase
MQANISSMKQNGNYFSEAAVATAAAIVRVFETGSAVGDFTEVAVLNDGAGVSYGVSQFTHRSGSLLAVVEEYLANGGVVGACVLEASVPVLRDRSPRAVAALSRDTLFKKALAAAGLTREMRSAQHRIAFDMYMRPAIAACAGSGFKLPLSLAVIYDSMTHGSYHKIRDWVRVTPATPSQSFERQWITEYVRRRDAWLASMPRLRATRYRTRFFLSRIALGKWHLELPIRVNGVLISNEILDISPAPADGIRTAVGPYAVPPPTTTMNTESTINPIHPASTPQAQPPAVSALDDVEERVNAAAAKYDQVERIASTVINRTDRAKSLWTTIAGTLWQTGWALFGVAAGLPREVWFFVAGATAVLTLFYLYRQIALGKLRESLESRL